MKRRFRLKNWQYNILVAPAVLLLRFPFVGLVILVMKAAETAEIAGAWLDRRLPAWRGDEW